MIIDHITIITIDIIINAYQVGLGDNREIIRLVGGIGGRIVLDDQAILAADDATALVGIALHDMGHHLLINRLRDTHHERGVLHLSYHNTFASKLSSSSSNSSVHRSSLKYFQPPSARMTTIFACSSFSA